MSYRVIIFVLLCSLSFKAISGGKRRILHFEDPRGKRWVDRFRGADKELNAIRFLVLKLQETKVGQKLILKAMAKATLQGTKLLDVIHIGEVSLTDTTLLRRFSTDNPIDIEYEVRQKVYVNRNLGLKDAILDFAHELTHYVYKDGFNPYQKKQSIESFVKSTIEGKGGEVDAYITECRLLFELYGKKDHGRYHCLKLIDKKGNISRKKVVRQFYQLGAYFRKFRESLAQKGGKLKHFEHAGHGPASFISSAYSMPYPLAAMEEYSNIMEKVCKNDQKRFSLLRNTPKGRFPASEAKISKEIQGHNRRCQAWL